MLDEDSLHSHNVVDENNVHLVRCLRGRREKETYTFPVH